MEEETYEEVPEEEIKVGDEVSVETEKEIEEDVQTIAKPEFVPRLYQEAPNVQPEKDNFKIFVVVSTVIIILLLIALIVLSRL